MNLWSWIGIILSLAIIGVVLWWYYHRSKPMIDKPKPKDPHT